MRLYRDLTEQWQMPADTNAGIFGPDRDGRYAVAWGTGYDAALDAESVMHLAIFFDPADSTAADGMEFFGPRLAEAEAYAAEVAEAVAQR